ncbi:MAG TPA: hypothetical protein ENN69_05640, partial [Spirochaetia bacterium]|nr:hypothetical protein [Spirochaetia bacterium]
MKTRVRILGLFVAVAVCFACQSTGASSRELLDALARDFPRIDGSTSAMPLQRKLACDVYGIPWTWSTGDLENGLRNIIPDGEKDPSPEAAAAVFAIRHSGTNGAYMALIERKADFILVARAPSPDELEAARAAGVILDARPVALDAFVFLAHTTNPLSSVTLKEVRAIYTGKLTSWDELGVRVGTGEVDRELIHAYQRERNSGSQELMETLVMKNLPMIEAPSMIRMSMLGPFNAIGGDRFTGRGGDPLGFSYTVYY